MVRAYLLDIEGTTTPINFVYDTLFPYARSRIASFVASGRVTELEIKALREENPSDSSDPTDILLALMDADKKSPVLKEVQGRIWQEGYGSGELQGVVYPDVVPFIRRVRADGCKVAIYSSGSVLAQKLIFGHLPEGDLTTELDGFFDTSVGGKRERDSYERIAELLEFLPSEIVCVSDIAEEIVAARNAGFQVFLIWRPQDGKPKREVEGVKTISTLTKSELS